MTNHQSVQTARDVRPVSRAVSQPVPRHEVQRFGAQAHQARRHHQLPGVLAEPGQHPAAQNHLLAALREGDCERLLSKMDLVRMPLGWEVNGPGDVQKYLYFLTEGLVSQFYVMSDGAQAGFALAGMEGAVGVASFLGGRSMPSQAVVVSPGFAWRMRADVVEAECEHSGPLLKLLLRYTMLVIAQTGQAAACSRHHSVSQRLCTLILTRLDRMPSNELKVTQEMLANALGVRRESVTDAAGKLQAKGLIRYHRGSIAIVDRAGLEKQACECYEAVREEQERLFPDGTNAHASR